MSAKHKSTVYKPTEIPNPFTQENGQDKAYGDLLHDAIQEKKLWQKTTYVHLAFLVLALIFFFISLSRQDIVPVLVNVMPSGEAQYLGEVRQSGNLQVPDSAIHFQIRTFVSNLRTVSTDYMVVYQNIDDCLQMITSDYTPVFRRIILENSPFDLVGSIRRVVDVESVLHVTGRSYQINWSETVYDYSSTERTNKFRAVITIKLYTPTPQSIIKNPLGIYIENMEMIEL